MDGIDVETLADWRGRADPPVLVDVREDWERAICSLPGAVHLPLGALLQGTVDLARIVPPDRPLVVYCHHGLRSARAVSVLHEAGYGRAVNLEGGIDAWARRIDSAMAVY